MEGSDGSQGGPSRTETDIQIRDKFGRRESADSGFSPNFLSIYGNSFPFFSVAGPCKRSDEYELWSKEGMKMIISAAHRNLGRLRTVLKTRPTAGKLPPHLVHDYLDPDISISFRPSQYDDGPSSSGASSNKILRTSSGDNRHLDGEGSSSAPKPSSARRGGVQNDKKIEPQLRTYNTKAGSQHQNPRPSSPHVRWKLPEASLDQAIAQPSGINAVQRYRTSFNKDYSVTPGWAGDVTDSSAQSSPSPPSASPPPVSPPPLSPHSVSSDLQAGGGESSRQPPRLGRKPPYRNSSLGNLPGPST
ncbi:hypothetical protein DL93DRAFT_2172337 [Clavulina sp. PMI_390]|nr:hypothetical protein DL93DRAFT_2172337 [Clavulina sp. PMI_390]